MNGTVEAANKNIKKILVRMTNTYKDWHKYSLVYGMEAVLPTEVEIPSLRIFSQAELLEVEWACARYEQLNMIDEKHMIVVPTLR